MPVSKFTSNARSANPYNIGNAFAVMKPSTATNIDLNIKQTKKRIKSTGIV